MWTSVDADPVQNNFTASAGVKATLGDWSDTYAVFRIFLDQILTQLIVGETNRYASEMSSQTKTVWKYVGIDEVMCYLAIVLMMGVVKKPSVKSYWSTEALFSTPYFATVMSRNQFIAISQFLHFCNNAENPGNDRFFKLRFFTEYLCKAFKLAFLPSRYVSVDESLLLWKGRLGWKQYIPKKEI